MRVHELKCDVFVTIGYLLNIYYYKVLNIYYYKVLKTIFIFFNKKIEIIR